MRAGRLRHRITIKQRASGRDASGAPVDTYTDVCTVWAFVSILTGKERWAGEHTLNNYDAGVTIRYRPDLTEDMQVHFEGRVLDIKNIIDPIGNKSDMILMCVDHG